MGEDIEVTIGGVAYALPPMSFYCLRRAWPHIQRLGAMGALNQAVINARMVAANAISLADSSDAAAVYDAAVARVAAEGADFVGQTATALEVIAAALSLATPAPSAEALSKALRPSEFSGLHEACQMLLLTSGLQEGEVTATGQQMPAPMRLNGTVSSLN